MDIRYEHYNSLTFEAYAKASIDNGIRKEVRQRARQRSMELPLSELTDPMQYRVCHEDLTAEAAEQHAAIFTVLGESIVVRDAQLAQALTYLLPHARDILLLTYFEDPLLAGIWRKRQNLCQNKDKAGTAYRGWLLYRRYYRIRIPP